MKNRIMGELKRVFRPEFLNRIDEVIVFHKLQKDEITEIVELLLRRVRESMAERELSLNLSEEARDVLVEKGWDPAMGARPLRRAIQRYIEDPLADEVLKATDMKPGSTVEVDAHIQEKGEDGKDKEPEVKITIRKPERKREAVGVGAKGGEDAPSDEGGDSLPDDPEVLPDVPDAPPADDQTSE
jgi:ATP-dependent Clp protease ATP-binding subunit ClpC